MAFSTSRLGGVDERLSWLLFDVSALAAIILAGLAVAAVEITSRESVRPEEGEAFTE
jgi:hypothetical protein